MKIKKRDKFILGGIVIAAISKMPTFNQQTFDLASLIGLMIMGAVVGLIAYVIFDREKNKDAKPGDNVGWKFKWDAIAKINFVGWLVLSIGILTVFWLETNNSSWWKEALTGLVWILAGVGLLFKKEVVRKIVIFVSLLGLFLAPIGLAMSAPLLFSTAFRNENFLEISAMIFGIVFSFVFFIIVYKILHSVEVRLEFSKPKSGQEYLNSVVSVQQQSADLAKKEPDAKSIKAKGVSASPTEYSKKVVALLKEDKFKLGILLILLLAIPITWHYFRTLPAEIVELEYCSSQGFFKDYNSRGHLFQEGVCKNGKLDGLYKYYNENGQLEIERFYKNGKRDGLAKYYLESGKLESEVTYKNGKREGLTKKYYENGNLKVVQTYKNDKLEGPAKVYRESGGLILEATLRDGKEDGKSKTYREDGSIEYIDAYKNGEKINRKAFDIEGKLLFDQDY